ncbi:MAG: Flp pilus assembly protein CpaB [Desulfobacula sp.]|uniref:Flp pilus assembly protein CpaB n=1 Tax=Desulfobacula sp. TaxID=2593537 RepID=UPI0025B88AD2|nr:Flp pilus assembly protein CpaB [Desulfobacula sp.]MCD4719818.1 Flp pilus assembly protein CpaB [Desulfobacula sp.]
MFNAKTIIAILFSLFMGILAVLGYSVFTRQKPVPQPVSKEERQAVKETKQVEPVPEIFSDSIPKGKRIVSIKVDEVSGATRVLEKNDRVDVIAVTDLNGTMGGKIARAVLQNVIIFDIEDAYFKKELTDRITKKKKNWTLQLLVSLDQAVLLSSVDEAAMLRLVLRNQDDTDLQTAGSIIYTSETGTIREGEPDSDPAVRILPGMRAISLNVNNKDSICGKLNPGDKVDVIMSFKVARFSTNEGNMAVGTKGEVFNSRKSSKILLQNVMVISTDPQSGHAVKKTKPVSRVTLMVSPKDAEKIAVITDASNSAVIRLILRNPGDNKKVATSGEIFSDLVLKDKKSYRIINIVKGTKAYPRKFYDDE